MHFKSVLMDQEQMDRALTRIAHEILEKNSGSQDIALVGIRRRGVPLAQRLANKIERIEGKKPPLGELDITFYRDDIGHMASHPVFNGSEINYDLAKKKIILVDDVLYTGRTARAAIEALFDLGRPRSIQLAVMLDRGHREIPIRADYVGKNVPTSRIEHIRVELEEVDENDRVLLFSEDPEDRDVK